MNTAEMNTEDYLFELRFWPAFLSPSCWTVYRQDETTTLEVQLQTVKEAIASRTPNLKILTVAPDAAQHLYQTCNNTLIQYNDNWCSPGRDGIVGEGLLWSDYFTVTHFEFWSPRRYQPAYQLVMALFDVLATPIVDVALRNYTVRLRSYFDG